MTKKKDWRGQKGEYYDYGFEDGKKKTMKDVEELIDDVVTDRYEREIMKEKLGLTEKKINLNISTEEYWKSLGLTFVIMMALIMSYISFQVGSDLWAVFNISSVIFSIFYLSYKYFEKQLEEK